MSRGEVNARRSTVTLHLVSSLDGLIAKKDNSVSWMDSPGDVYEKGVSEGDADDVVTSDRLLCARFSYIRACASTRLAIWRYSDRRDHKQRTAIDKEEC